MQSAAYQPAYDRQGSNQDAAGADSGFYASYREYTKGAVCEDPRGCVQQCPYSAVCESELILETTMESRKQKNPGNVQTPITLPMTIISSHGRQA